MITRPTCSVEAVDSAWDFARRYDMIFHTDLVHYQLPYFVEGRDRDLQIGAAEMPAVRAVVARLLELKRTEPRRIPESAAALASIPDWLASGRVPCGAAKLVWVGADGTVKLCYVTFELGNLHRQRLRDLLGTAAHHLAARDSFLLNCPNCHCERATRID